MSRSKQDILDTESMLVRLSSLLLEHRDLGVNTETGLPSLVARDDAESLRRISMTLHAWHEKECNGYVGRDEATGKTYWNGTRDYNRRIPTPDLEGGAERRLKAIMARYPSLQAYIQTDPRGCALYILKPGDVPAGADVSAYYSRGLAVY